MNMYLLKYFPSTCYLSLLLAMDSIYINNLHIYLITCIYNKEIKYNWNIYNILSFLYYLFDQLCDWHYKINEFKGELLQYWS